MDKINWANYNYEDFTQFCNALLTFEFGKDFQGFSAPGKDGGIDGMYEGNYSNISGLWRFQYKFRQGPRIEGVRNLKSQIKSELANLNDERVFVLITNIELLPQELKELENAFREEISNLNKHCICLIWDGAKLFNLYLQYPILQLWLLDGFNSAQLQDYHSVFKKNIERDINDFSPDTLNNLYISRENENNYLNDFLSDNKTITLITGEAGIGKTRLIIEFFRAIVDKLDNWSALVLRNRNIEFDKIRKSLSGTRNYIILIDDAHTYSPEIISDMKAICEDATNKIKLILTARNIEAFKSLNLLKEYEKSKINQYNLKELSRPDTESFFKKYIENTPYIIYITELVEISYGKPILIVAILNAIRNDVLISQIRKQDFLKSYVKNYFNSYYNQVHELTNWPVLKIERILRHIVLIEPVNYNDNNVLQKFSELHEVNIEDLYKALNILIDYGFVDGRYEQSIKPDYYSDILLSEISYKEVEKYIDEFSYFLDNIIVNLSSVDEITKINGNILDEILNKYSNFITEADNIETIDRVLSTIYSISAYKPDIAKKTVQLFIDCLSNEQHVIYKEVRDKKSTSNYSANTALNRLIDILSFLLNQSENYDFVYRKSFKLFELTNEIKISNIYSFGLKDVVQKFNFNSQKYFINEFTKKSDKLDRTAILFGISVFKSMLNLEFTVSGMSASNRMAISITTYYLPSNVSVKKLRQSIANSLIKVYNLPNAVSLKLEILKCLLDIPRSIFSTKRNTKPYQNNEEISIVLNFLENQAELFNILEKKEIQDRLFWFKQWGIPEEFLVQLETIKKRLEPKNLTEQFSQIFTQAELSLVDVKTYVQEKCDNLVANNDKHQMAISIIEYLEPQTYQPHYFIYFLYTLIDKYPEYAKELYKCMFDLSSKLFDMYASVILSGAYYTFQDKNFYWNNVKTLEKIDSYETDNILLSVYGNRVPGFSQITEKDTSLIIRIFKKKRKENHFFLASGIQSLIAAQHPQTYEVCQDFLKRVDQKEANMFFLRLSDNKTVSSELFTDLVLNHTLRFYLSYEIERCLNLVLIQDNLELVFNYLTKRFEYKKQIVISQRSLRGYEFVPHGDHSHMFDNCPVEYKTSMFKMAMEWYLSLEKEGGHLFYAKDLLEYLQPSNYLTHDLLSWFKLKITEKTDNPEGLDRILEILSIFHVKDETLLELVIDAYTIGYEFSETKFELFRRINQEGYSAITTLGVKEGTSGEPFQVDLDLQNLLTLKINDLPDYLPVKKFLKGVLKSVNSDIDLSLDSDNLKW